jgi:hypothetical protein
MTPEKADRPRLHPAVVRACEPGPSPALSNHGHRSTAGAKSPGGSARATMVGVLACDGAFGTSTQRGKDRRLERGPLCWRAGDPGGPLRPFPAERQQWRRRRRPPRGTWPTRPQLRSWTQIAADAGAARRPRGPPRSRGAVVLVSDPDDLTPAAALEEARPGLLGPEDNRPQGCRKAPAYPSHPRAPCRAGRTARAPSEPQQ